MAQKSWVSGAPTSAAQVLRAEAPGMISTSMPESGVQPAWNSTSKVGPAMPYTPASPDEISATLRPWRARSKASMARSSSSVIDFLMTSLPSSSSATRRM
jgi:hypothetical protein